MLLVLVLRLCVFRKERDFETFREGEGGASDRENPHIQVWCAVHLALAMSQPLPCTADGALSASRVCAPL